MSADNVIVQGRVAVGNENKDEIQKVLFENLSEFLERRELRIDDKINYLELDYEESWGRCGSLFDYLKNKFIKLYPEVKLELYYTIYYPDGSSGEKIVYDGKRITITSHGTSLEDANFLLDLECPECGNKLLLCGDYCFCEECSEEFYGEDLDTDIDFDELYWEKVLESDSRLAKELEYQLIK